MKTEIKKNGCKAIITETTTGFTFHFYRGKSLERGTTFSKRDSLKEMIEYFEKCIENKENSKIFQVLFGK